MSNPYREPGDRSCIVELIEDVLENNLPKQRTAARAVMLGTEMSQIDIINQCIGPRLKVTRIDRPLDRLADDLFVTVEGRGGVSCDLRFRRRDLELRGRTAPSQDRVLYGLIEAILEALPE